MTKPYVVVAFPAVDWPEMRNVIAPQAILQKGDTTTWHKAQESAEEANFMQRITGNWSFTYKGMSREDFNKLEG